MFLRIERRRKPLIIDVSELVFGVAMYPVVFGVAILYGGQQRFSGPSFEVAKVAPYWVWGTFYLLGGIFLHYVRIWKSHWLPATFFLASLPYFLFAISLAAALGANPVAAMTGVITYGHVALIYVWLSVRLPRAKRSA